MRKTALAPGVGLALAAVLSAAGAGRAQPSRDAVAARRAFELFLHGMLEQPEWVEKDTSFHRVMDDCGRSAGRDFRSYWMASYRIVAVHLRGGRGTGVVDVLAAGEQAPDPIGWTRSRARLRVAHHVMRFPLRRDEVTRRWRVCVVSQSGWQLGHDSVPHHLRSETDVIFAAIDSIRGVPHRRWYTIRY